MTVKLLNSSSSFELLPSILIQKCMNCYFIYISWLTFTISIEP